MRTSLLLVALLACGNDPSMGGPDAATGPDAPDGTGCTTTTPRTAEPETFVGPTGLESRLAAIIDGAHTSLDIQMYLFTDGVLRDRVVAAQGRGVQIRVILDTANEPGDATARSAFQSAGIQVRSAATMYTFSHAKYLIVDHATAVIMSMNFNTDAMKTERNYGMIDTDIEDVADVQAIFETDWALAAGQPATQPNLACTRLVVSPTNAEQRELELIGRATTTLDVEAFYISDTTVRNSLAQAHNRGVTLRLILADPSDQPDNATTATFFANLGVEVKYAKTFFLHAKLVVADGVAFIGSQNFSSTSLTQNREVGAMVFESGPEATIQSQFESDWTTTTPAP